MTRAVEIRTDIATAADLRRQARREPRRRTALRLLAVANALDGMSRAEAARAAGIERQALCDEPPRVYRRLFVLGQAARAWSLTLA